jgi:hypothetical protein
MRLMACSTHALTFGAPNAAPDQVNFETPTAAPQLQGKLEYIQK